MEQPGLACALTRMETSRLTLAASIQTSTHFGVVNGKPHGVLTRRTAHCQALSRLTITTLRMEISTLVSRKNSAILPCRALTLKALSQRSIRLRRSIRKTSKWCMSLWAMFSSAWGEPFQLLEPNSTGPTLEWWWIDWDRTIRYLRYSATSSYDCQQEAYSLFGLLQEKLNSETI